MVLKILKKHSVQATHINVAAHLKMIIEKIQLRRVHFMKQQGG